MVILQVATGSVDASIKILDVERMLAKSAPEETETGRGEQQGHPVIRTLYDHTDEVSFLEFHPKEPVLASGSRDCTVKLFDISKASVKKAHKVFTVSDSPKEKATKTVFFTGNSVSHSGLPSCTMFSIPSNWWLYGSRHRSQCSSNLWHKHGPMLCKPNLSTTP